VSELDDFRASLGAFLTARNPVERTLEVIERGGHHDPVLWKEMARLGLQGIAVPEGYGGAGADRAELAVVFEELAAALVTEPFLATVGLAVPALVEGGDEAAREEFLPAIASGALTATVVSGVRAAGDCTLDGVDEFVLDGAVADLVLVDADTAHGPALFAVTGGFDRIPLDTLDPTRRMARLEFRRTPSRRIGAGGTGRRTALLALAAEQLGVARRCLELSVEYAKARVQFGRPIGSFQAVKHLCANMLLEVELARSAVEHAAADGGEPAVDLAHAFCVDAAVRVAGDCIQVHGGIGYTWEHPAHLYLKRAKTNQHLFGGARSTRRRIAERIGA
jgi:alkylation response protein AidB-like acyl-CoA dehydrogenase